jgi:hypothetical protein
MTKLIEPETVADILERELQPTIKEWLSRVNLVSELTNVPLSDQDRTGHLPKLFHDLISRLRLARDAKPPVSAAAAAHGRVRLAQGYSASMLIEESRLFQVSTFGTLHRHQDELNQKNVLLDVMTIADEVDAQLRETVVSFMAGKAALSVA